MGFLLIEFTLCSQMVDESPIRVWNVYDPTPSPADYNVELKKPSTGAVIPKGERFVDLKSPSLSDTSISSSSNNICFRTPNPPKSSKSNNHQFVKTKSTELFKFSAETEALKEKIVECNNKDETIRELTEQIEDMKSQLSGLETSITLYNYEKEECEEKIKALQSEHETTINDLKQKHQAEIDYYAEKIPTTEANLEEIKRKYEQLKQENRKELLTLLSNINKFEDLYNTSMKNFQKELREKEEELEQLKDKIEILRVTHAEEIENLNKEHAEELQMVKIEMLKNIQVIENKLEKAQEESNRKMKILEKSKNEELLNFKEKYEKDKLRLSHDYNAKIRQMEENYKDANKLSEIQMKERCQEIEFNFKVRLEQQQKEADAILKECQAISEYNIIQCEIEKSTIKKDLADKAAQYESLLLEKNNLQQSCNDLSKQCKDLKLKFDNATTELETVRSQLQNEILEHKKSITQAENDKKAYELALNKTYTTIEALKNRLLNSDHDVEQLKSELESTEVSKLEFEGRCNQLLAELQLVTNLYEEVEICNEKTLKIAEDKIKILEKELLNKVDVLKDTAEDTQKALLTQLEQYKNELDVAKKHLKEQNELNTKAQELIQTSSKELNGLIVENEQLENENYKKQQLIEELEKKYNILKKEKEEILINYECDRDKMLRQEIKLKEADQIKEEFLEQTRSFEDLLRKINGLERKNEELEKKVLDQESLIGPFRDQLEAYEMEYKVLVSQKSNIENEAKEMGLKYAELLGHQNQKQKIKYMVELKRKNFELQEQKGELEKKLRAQTRQIEKLKRDLEKNCKVTPKKMKNGTENKENLLSPSTNHLGSPGPLKERN
ncbi:hyaluronan-mediated motility receptor-like [Agrilus planipennis]|uniref:Hyaluronan-mediated motility receptor-like n=1 Tax=Agrilus planipennis TaxID=224129 RepID=A0A7F5RGB5_AGRPL|nr:hyaluronan-mediated motility receptor-like [Agrilus planipennis]